VAVFVGIFVGMRMIMGLAGLMVVCMLLRRRVNMVVSGRVGGVVLARVIM